MIAIMRPSEHQSDRLGIFNFNCHKFRFSEVGQRCILRRLQKRNLISLDNQAKKMSAEVSKGEEAKPKEAVQDIPDPDDFLQEEEEVGEAIAVVSYSVQVDNPGGS